MAHYVLRAFLFSLFFFSLQVCRIKATGFDASNATPGSRGGRIFDLAVGASGAVPILEDAMRFAQFMFDYQNPATPKRTNDMIHLVVEDLPGKAAYAEGNTIHLSADHVAACRGINIAREIRGVLYHEMVHLWQWFGKDGSWAPSGVTEGIADFVRLKAGLGKEDWRPGSGQRWDEGYSATALFLNYVDNLRPGFVAELNKKLSNGWSESYFQDLTGRSVQELWNEYKAKNS